MPRNDLAGSAVPVSHKPGVSGALARFCQRSYAADYIALACLVAGWVLVGLDLSPYAFFRRADESIDPTLREPLPSPVLPEQQRDSIPVCRNREGLSW